MRPKFKQGDLIEGVGVGRGVRGRIIAVEMKPDRAGYGSVAVYRIFWLTTGTFQDDMAASTIDAFLRKGLT